MSAEEKKRLAALYAGYAHFGQLVVDSQSKMDKYLGKAARAERAGKKLEALTWFNRALQLNRVIESVGFSMCNDPRLREPFKIK